MIVYVMLIGFLALSSCSTKKGCATNYDELLTLCDSLDDHSIYFDHCLDGLPMAFSDTLIKGYTDFRGAYFYDTVCVVNSMNAEGYQFSNGERTWYYYSFVFADEGEIEAFRTFTPYSDNYMEHSQNPCEYFQLNGTWYLRYLPTP